MNPRKRRPIAALGGGLWSARSWRATLHVLAGMAVGVGAYTTFGVLLVVWIAAIWSLAEGPTGADWLVAVYVVAALAGPAALLGCLRAFSDLQKARFRTILGVEIPERPRATGRWRLLRAILGATTWRQFAHLLFGSLISIAGGAMVATCLSAIALAFAYATARPWPGAMLVVLAAGLLLATPWLARGVARVDEATARALLGPGRTQELAQRIESLTRSRAEIVAATDAERRRIERDLHDGAQQRLVSLAMNLGMARVTLTDEGPARQVIEEAHEEATQALAELREFVRGLHPAVLNDRGLDAALSGVAARAPLPVRLSVDVEPRCSPSIEAIAYFIVSEALTNVAKHANALQAEVSVVRTGKQLRVVITDDGQGGAVVGSGLRGLTQRAAAVDGTLTLHSPPGGPTTITAELPCE